MTQMPSSAVIPDIWMSGLGLCFAAWLWIQLTRWGNSESVFFGVRTVKKFEESAEAQKIDTRYLYEIVALTGAIILLNILILLLLYFRQLLPSVHPYDFWPLELLHALGVRIAYWRARNRTLPFAAAPDAVRTVDLASLTPPSRIWSLLYWPCVFLPLIAIAIFLVYLRYWAGSQAPVPNPIAFPITAGSPPMTWSQPATFHNPRLLTEAILVDIAGVLVAFAIGFHSRVNEWGEDDEERWSYRKLLMMATAAPPWLVTALAIVLELGTPPLRWDDTTVSRAVFIIGPFVLVWALIMASLSLPFLLYYKRPVGTVNRAQDDCWKFGLFYFNPQDGAWVVPARFGAGISLNFGQPLAWMLILLSVTGLGLRWYVKSPTPHYEPNDSVQAQFATAARQLSGGEFAASERLLYIARHTNDPTVWSSVAYELTVNDVKPDSARQWAEKAVAWGEGEYWQSDLPSVIVSAAPSNCPNPANCAPDEPVSVVDRPGMARLAALWSNLGYVCSRQGDLDCALRYLIAAWTLDPMSAYGNDLAAVLKALPKPPNETILSSLNLQNGVPVRRVVNVSVPRSTAGTAYFDVLLSAKYPAEIQWAGGDKSLSGALESITPNLNFPWPEVGGVAKVELREKLTCTGVQSACELTMLSPEETIAGPEQAVK
jgi:uncharacterized membrane protein